MLRVSDELVDERGRRAQHTEDPLPPDARRRELGRERRDPPVGGVAEPTERLGDADQPEQALVRVGGVAHDGGEVVELAAGDGGAHGQQRLVVDEPDGPVGIGEP